jgi:hypothetical protein
MPNDRLSKMAKDLIANAGEVVEGCCEECGHFYMQRIPVCSDCHGLKCWECCQYGKRSPMEKALDEAQQ